MTVCDLILFNFNYIFSKIKNVRDICLSFFKVKVRDASSSLLGVLDLCVQRVMVKAPLDFCLPLWPRVVLFLTKFLSTKKLRKTFNQSGISKNTKAIVYCLFFGQNHRILLTKKNICCVCKICCLVLFCVGFSFLVKFV